MSCDRFGDYAQCRRRPSRFGIRIVPPHRAMTFPGRSGVIVDEAAAVPPALVELALADGASVLPAPVVIRGHADFPHLAMAERIVDAAHAAVRAGEAPTCPGCGGPEEWQPTGRPGVDRLHCPTCEKRWTADPGSGPVS